MPPKRAVVVGGGIGAPGQKLVARLAQRCVAQLIAYRPGQNPRPAFVGVHLQHAMHVLGPVDDNGDIATLAGQAGAASAREHGRAKLAAGGDGLYHIFFRFGNDDADGYLAVVRGVGGIHRLAAGVEADLALDVFAQLGFKSGSIHMAAGLQPVCGTRIAGSW